MAVHGVSPSSSAIHQVQHTAQPRQTQSHQPQQAHVQQAQQAPKSSTVGTKINTKA